MKVTCDVCHKEIETVDIDLDKGIARCPGCNTVFDCSSKLESVGKYRRDKIGLPGSIKLRKEDGSLKIEYRWLSSQLMYLTPFCLAWDALPVIWYVRTSMLESNPGMLLYLIVHLLVGIGLTYYCLAGFLNKTTVSVADGNLQVRDTPLTFLRNMAIPNDQLDQLYAMEKVHRGRKISWSSYEVHAITKPGRIVRLVAGLNNSEQALYIEQVVEDHLGILDRPVEGEIPR
ncbi:MAG: hypothetical protein GY866_15805 [Proteobacteria bacterium]|nr:hypothetical protein [Pseudomonadota bacterium]